MFRRCASSIVYSISESNLTDTEIKTKKERAYTEYSKLFHPDVLDKIKYASYDVTKSKHPFWSFTYDKEYAVLVYKINISTDSSFKDLVKIHNKKVDHFDVNYRGSELDEISFTYNDLHDSIIKNLNIIYEGELINSLDLNDSLMFLDLNCEKLGFYYETGPPADILIHVKKLFYNEKGPPRTRFNVVIIKNNHSLFIIALRPRTRGRHFDKLFLLNLLDRKIYPDTTNNSN
ncbi:MAG: hypothetical protein IM600_07330 [Bacteroidetes bacterium]|nr:hypothetical protein [Bacteroidota bacterium]MCA6443220.1 hypothetical protein [Bacteroidota bacterium]